MSRLPVLCEHTSECVSCVYVQVHISFSVGALFARSVFPTRPCMSRQAAGLQGRWQWQLHCCRSDILLANPGGRNHLFRHQIKAEDTPHNRCTHTRCFLRHTCAQTDVDLQARMHTHTKRARVYSIVYLLTCLHTQIQTYKSTLLYRQRNMSFFFNSVCVCTHTCTS